jgi:ribosomal protein S12 methylthiotransferase accessory factor
LHRHGERLSELPSRRRTRFAAEVVAALVADAVETLITDPSGASSQLRHAVRLINLRGLGLSRHRVLPDPACADCGGLPADDAAAARFVARARPKLAPDVFRVRALAPRDAELRDRYVDAEVGLIRSVSSAQVGGPGGFVLGAAQMSARGGPSHGHSEDDRYGWGRTLDVSSAELIAVMEALERLGGEAPGGRRTVVRGSYREFAADALDPRTLGLHSDEQYASPGFGFRRYDEDLVVRWVWGYSFARRGPVLVPQRCAYYGVRDEDDPPFVYEISNGCALGGCLEEAVLGGLLEIAERDAFLMTWYGRLPVPRIDPMSAHDRTIPLLTTHLRQQTGHEIRLFDTTVEQGVPTFWVMAVDPHADPSRAQALCAAGSAILPEQGVLNALHELATLLDDHHRAYDADTCSRAGAMVADPSLVTTMADHSLLYCHHEARERLNFLDDGPTRTFDELASRWSWPTHDDLSADLGEMVGRYLAGGLDVIMVDQTTPEHRLSGLSAVKVMVPGTLPMTFGHRHRRTEGLPRLLRIPYLMGYRDRPLTPAEINPHPHPFP